MSSEERRAAVQKAYDEAPFVQMVGLELVEVEPGMCVTRLRAQTSHLQHLGRVHGAALATLAGQNALGAAMSVIEADEYVVCPDFKVSLMRAAPAASLLSRAEVVKSGRSLVFVEANITEEGTDRLIARASYTFTRLRAEG